MTELTSRFALPLLQPGQAQKEIFHNEALTGVDALLHPAVETLAANVLPVDPAPGMSWIVGASAGGAWTGRKDDLAIWTVGGWRFTPPVPGMMIWLTAESRWVWHDGIAWRNGAMPTGGISVNGKAVVGERQPAIPTPTTGADIDPGTRQAVLAILSALRAHGLIEP